MKNTVDTLQTEDHMMAPFFIKQPIAIDRGEGVHVFDETGHRYLDFTAGWGVTSLGHAHPVIIAALNAQAGKIIQNPNSGLTYSPARAGLLSTLSRYTIFRARRLSAQARTASPGGMGFHPNSFTALAWSTLLSTLRSSSIGLSVDST